MIKIKKLEHVGIAVENTQKSLDFWKTLGLNLTDTEEIASDKVKTYFLPIGESKLELLEATGPESPVAKFLAKRGSGIHHLCVDVEGLDALLEKLKQAGIRLIDQTPRKGAHGKRIVFVHPEATGGILLELSEGH